MSYTFPIPWPPRKRNAKGEDQEVKQRVIVVKAIHDKTGPQLEVNFNNGQGTVELPNELCRQEGSKMVPDEVRASQLFIAIREWASTVTLPETADADAETKSDRPAKKRAPRKSKT